MYVQYVVDAVHKLREECTAGDWKERVVVCSCVESLPETCQAGRRVLTDR